MQIYAGSTHPDLAQKLSKLSGFPVGKIEISQFPNHEIRIHILEDKIDREAIVIQSIVTHPNKAIMEFSLIMDALRRSGAREITAVIPWLGYCIQDKVFRKGEPLSARVVADLISASHPDKIITFDLHNETIQGFFNHQIYHLSAVPLLLEEIKKHSMPDIIVAPDVGALKESTKIAHSLDLPIAVLNKKRDLKTGKVEIIGIDRQIEGQHALIMDDFISTGSTLIQTVKYLKDHGVKHISVGVTHHLFVENTHQKLLQSGINDLYISNSVTLPKNLETANDFHLHQIDISPEINKYL